MSYTVKLKEFEGPFDLLLFFIQRDELDIYDIPIAKLTDDFLSYMRQMEALNIDMASEFILVAATLMRIKAKMLLPRQPLDDEGDAIDPRKELVQRLLEYKRYKEVLDDMRALEQRRAKMHPRGNLTDEMQRMTNQALVDMELESLNLYNLMKAFYRVLERQKETKKAVHAIVRYSYTIEEQQSYVLKQLQSGKKTRFETIFSELENRIHAIVTFLGMLELINQQRVKITQGEGANNFWLQTGNDTSVTEDA